MDKKKIKIGGQSIFFFLVEWQIYSLQSWIKRRLIFTTMARHFRPPHNLCLMSLPSDILSRRIMVSRTHTSSLPPSFWFRLKNGRIKKWSGFLSDRSTSLFYSNVSRWRNGAWNPVCEEKLSFVIHFRFDSGFLELFWNLNREPTASE